MDRTRTQEEMDTAGSDYMTMLAVECGDLDYPRPVDAAFGWTLLTVDCDIEANRDARTYDQILDATIADITGWRHL
tara:strand:- start:4480 stop:4707 length:228 start_codon:yes stop_codon:yes gene_type:complete